MTEDLNRTSKCRECIHAEQESRIRHDGTFC